MVALREVPLFLAVALGLSAPLSAAPPAPLDLALVLAVDVSGSIDADERDIQRAGYVAALRHPDLVRTIRTGREGRVAVVYFEWSGRVFDGSRTPWIVIEGPAGAESLAAAIASLPVHSNHATSIARALDAAAALLAELPNPTARRVIDISGDGPNNIGPSVAAARDRVVRRGATINGLPLLLRPSASAPDLARYFEDCVIGGDGAFLVAAFGMAEFAGAIRRKLVLEISGSAPTARLWLAAGPAPACEPLDRLGAAPSHTGLYD